MSRSTRWGITYQVSILTTDLDKRYTIYKPVDPVRIVVDFTDTKLAKGVPASVAANNGVINIIKISQSSEIKTQMAKVEIGLDKMMAHEVSNDNNKLLILIKPMEQSAETTPSSDLYGTGGKLIVENSNTVAGTTPTEVALENSATATAESAGASSGSTVAEVSSGKASGTEAPGYRPGPGKRPDQSSNGDGWNSGGLQGFPDEKSHPVGS